MSLTYDFGLNVANNGNVLQITNGVDNALTKRFTYDKLNRLATAFPPLRRYLGQYLRVRRLGQFEQDAGSWQQAPRPESQSDL